MGAPFVFRGDHFVTWLHAASINFRTSPHELQIHPGAHPTLSSKLPRMSIRDARAQDTPALETLARDLPTAAHWTPAQYHDLFTGTPRIVWLIEEDNIVVAFLVARSSGSDWEIENLAVAEARQRCGLATELLRALIARAAGSGATSIFLEVRASNLPAQRFYQAHAFCEAGRRPNYYASPGEDAIVLRRDPNV